MDFRELVQTRHSVRDFLPEPIPENVLNEMLEAARLAPSAQNRQPWRFVVITNREKIKEMVLKTGLLGLSNYFIRSAPCVVVACADTTKNRRINDQDYYLVDTAIAFQQMILMAWSHGIGSCWMAAFDEKKLKAWLELPESWRIVAMSPFGYPATKQGIYDKTLKVLARSKDRLPLEQIVRRIE
ncbi:MAG TPA: nitroreductase family protein [Candidatus Cloacimonadota bacterium]|nr:nitroreductase family protein [Candidatus Cloacimonadota bacterium]HQL15353.1 nitroreductase family protein [Candidatus Cloacimonadota bacterium]